MALINRAISQREINLLKFFVGMLFLGRAYQGLFFDLPLRAFFWDQHLLEGVVTTLTGDTWQNYVTNRTFNVDGCINFLGATMGVCWLIAAVVTFFADANRKWTKWVLYVGSVSLFILALLYWKQKFLALGQLFEYTIQVSAPLILVHAIFNGVNTPRFRMILKVIIAVSFVCHGFYAVGFMGAGLNIFGVHPQPGPWVQWCMHVFGFSVDADAKFFLTTMGVLDFLAAALLFFRPTFKLAIWYCIIWGFMTAFGRVFGNFYWDYAFQSLHGWTYQMVFRLIHGGLPLLLYLWSQPATPNTKQKDD